MAAQGGLDRAHVGAGARVVIHSVNTFPDAKRGLPKNGRFAQAHRQEAACGMAE